MRLRKLIVLGALVGFVGGMSSCAKKEETEIIDTTATTTETTAPPPPAPTPDTGMGMTDTTHTAH